MDADEARGRGLGAFRGALFASFASAAFWIAIAVIVVLLATSCSTAEEPRPLPRVTITEQAPLPDESHEVPSVPTASRPDEVRGIAASLGVDLSADSDAIIEAVGQRVCGILYSRGVSRQSLVFIMTAATDTGYTADEAAGILIAMVAVYCPEFEDDIGRIASVSA